MPRTIPSDYFRTGVWRKDTRAPQLASYTCLGCGVRHKTYGDFRTHRRVCTERMNHAIVPVWLAEQEERPRDLSPEDAATLRGLMDGLSAA